MFKLGKHAGSQFMQGINLWLEVDPDSAQSYQAKTRAVIHVSEFSRIHTNMLIRVKVDTRDKKAVWVDHWNAG